MAAIPDIKKLLSIAQKAGEAILEVYRSEFPVSHKDDATPLTKADLIASELIIEALSKLTPNLPVLSEESYHAPYEIRKNWKRYWLIDPLDGTREFVKKNGQFSVNIALIEEGAPILGVVHGPAVGESYWGVVGDAAWCLIANAEPCQIQARAESNRPYRVLVSNSHLNQQTKDYIEDLRRTSPQLETIALGSSLKMCRIATGEADIYPRLGTTMEWDTAAAHAVLKAAGGSITKIACGSELHYNKPDLENPWFVASR